MNGLTYHHFSADGGDAARCDDCGCTYHEATTQPRPCRPIRKAF